MSESGDTSAVSLDSLIVTARRNTSRVMRDAVGNVRWDLTMMEDMPKILGNADPVHYAQMLPGVQTNSELRSGLNIEGCDNAHTTFSVQGVPLYNVAHLLGIFSTFNSSHYPALVLEKSPQKGESPSRLGGRLDMQLTTGGVDSVNGIFTVGVMSSQGTLRVPVKKNTILTLSGRVSYLNLLYGSLLKLDEGQMAYDFFDVNATLCHKFSSDDRIIVDFYMGQDRARVYDEEYVNDYRDRWGNHLFALHWHHRGGRGWNMTHTLYNTRYSNRFQLHMTDIDVDLKSSIMDFGYKRRYAWRGLSFGAEYVHHIIQPQDPIVRSEFNVKAQHQDIINSDELSLWGDFRHEFHAPLEVFGGFRYTAYRAGKECFHGADPSAGMTWRPHNNVSLTASYAMRHQNLFQTGFSSMGLPTEFWLSAGEGVGRPQWSHGPTFSAAIMLWGGRFRLSADAWYKRLYNQVEYSGTPYDFVNSLYSLEKTLLHGSGENYGLSVMMAKCTGRFTGWVSYSWGRALRTYDYPQMSGTFPANHERIHELNLVLTWHLWRRWTLASTFVMASGTPFTAPKCFYMINGKILSMFAEHNANRLPAYVRWDVSVNCRLGSMQKRVQHFLNVSFYNVINHNNPLHYYLKIFEGRFSYRPLNMPISILPSVSYTLKF